MPAPTVKMAIGAHIDLEDLGGTQDSSGPRALVAPAPNFHVRCPIFSVNLDEDAESHLLCSDDWIKSQGILEKEKCATFCLTLVGDAHLWYVTIHLVDNDWPILQKLFNLQFSKLGYTQEGLFLR